MNLLDIVTKGSTDRSVVLRIIDETTGIPETGVVFNTSGIALWYRREGAAKTDITEATLAALTTAHTDGGFLHIADGEYRLDLPDAAFATSANYVDVGGTVTGMIVIGGRVRLVDYSLEDSVRMGMTALPNAAAEAAGGLYTRGTGAGQINQPANGMADGNVVRWLGTAAATPTVAGVPEVDVTHWGGTAIASAVILAAANLAANAINAAKLDPDVTTELQNGLATAATLATVAGYLDTEIAAILADTNELQTDWANGGRLDLILDARASQASVDTIDGIVDDILADTADMQPKIGTPAATLAADIAAIEAQTDDIGTAGAGLSAVPWNAAWDAEVQSEVADALAAYDSPTNAEMEARTLVAANYATAANLATVDTVVDGIKVTTDKVDDTLEDDAGTFRFTANALEEGPGGGSAPTVSEIADAVWEEAIADHSGTAGSTAEALNAAGSAGDPWVTALPGAYGAGSAGKIIGDNLNATVSSRATPAQVATELGTYDAPTKAELDAAVAPLATAANLATVDGIVDDILADTAAIDARLPSDPADASIVAAATGAILAAVGSPAGVSLSADVAAVKAQTAAIEADTQDLQTQVGTDGAGLTAIGDTRLANLDATVSSRATPAQVNTEADTALADVGLTTTITGRIDAAVSTRATPAQVNSEVVDALATDTYPEPSAPPAATASLKDKIGWNAALARNKVTQTATTQTLRNDADNGNIGTSTVSDDGTTFTRGEFS
jgi:hypothetical protein